MPQINLRDVLNSLQINPFELIGQTKKINQLKRKAFLYCHPDKHPNDEQDAWTELSKKIGSMFDILNDPASATIFAPYTFTHQYSASTEEGDVVRIKTYDFTYTIDLPGFNSPIVQELLKIVWELTDEELNQINKSFKTLMVDFSKQIVAMRKASPIDLMFSSSKRIEDDLESLISNQQDEEFSAKIHILKSSQPKYDTFQEDWQNHSELFLNFYQHYFYKKEFNENLFKIYLRIASRQKEQQAHWLCNRETYANFTGILLKVPGFFVWTVAIFSAMMFTVLAMMFTVLPLFLLLLLTPPADIALSTALNAFMVWAVVIGAGIAITKFFNISLTDEAIDNFIQRPITPYATFIDRIVETIFDVKLHATDLAGILFKIHGNSPREANLANASQYLSKFGFCRAKPERHEHYNFEEMNPGSERLLLTNG